MAVFQEVKEMDYKNISSYFVLCYYHHLVSSTIYIFLAHCIKKKKKRKKKQPTKDADVEIENTLSQQAPIDDLNWQLPFRMEVFSIL